MPKHRQPTTFEIREYDQIRAKGKKATNDLIDAITAYLNHYEPLADEGMERILKYVRDNIRRL